MQGYVHFRLNNLIYRKSTGFHYIKYAIYQQLVGCTHHCLHMIPNTTIVIETEIFAKSYTIRAHLMSNVRY